MSTPSPASASLRLPALPPTLQPHAIADMAPPASRGVSAAIALSCYALLGGAGLAAVHLTAQALEPRVLVTGPPVLLREDRPVPAQLTPRPAAAPQGRTEGHAASAITPAVSTEPIPETPLSGLTGPDRSFDPTVGTRGTGPTSTTGTPATTGFPSSGAPVEVAAAHVAILSQVQPVYPSLARVARIQGPVVLRMTINPQGVPTEVQVTSGHPALQAEAVRAARLWRFVPANVNGQAVAATFELTILFSLR